MPNFNILFKELRKRKVFRSLAIYAGASFIILQVCSIVFPALLLPEWSMRLVVVLLIIGFPTLIIFSWIYDVTPEGVVKTQEEEPSKSKNYIMIILILVVVGGLLFYYRDGFLQSTINPKSVAVLPFANYSPKAEDIYLSAGFTEVIIANLSKIKDLMVISRTSVMRYQDTDMNLKEIAKELNVANILEGSIQRTGNKIRVVGQLIEAKTDKHIWAETYDSDFNDIFSIQTSIATEIASALKSQITEGEKSVIEDKLTDNIEAYEMYLKVKELRREAAFKSHDLRKELLKTIIELDPEFAEAYALASIQYSEGVHYGYASSQKKIEKAKFLINKAFHLKPESAYVQFAYGYYYYGCYKDYLRALKHYEYALSKEPGNADYNAYIGYVHRRLGNWDETLKYLEKALDLDPNDLSIWGGLVSTYLFLKKYDKLNYIALNKKLSTISPEDGSIYSDRASLTFWLEGHTLNARQIIKTSQELTPDFDYYPTVLLTLDLFDQNYSNVLDFIQNVPDSIFFTQTKIISKYAATGTVYYLMDDEANNKLEYEKALDHFLTLTSYEGDPRYHAGLSSIYAMLDEPITAVQQAKMAISLAPPRKDIFSSDHFEFNLAAIYSLIGEYDKALDIFNKLLSEPSNYKWHDIKYDPLLRKIYKNNTRLNTMIQKDEDRFRKEATYNISVFLP